MHIWVDTANLDEIRQWVEHRWVSGVTTNPSLARAAGNRRGWKKEAIAAVGGKAISIDGLESSHFHYPENVWEKVQVTLGPYRQERFMQTNWTAVCSISQIRCLRPEPTDIVSVFAGRIMDTGRDPQPVIDAAKETGAQVLWASCREPYNLIQAEQAGCDIITVPPAILQKWLDWQGKPLETVADETIEQFRRDSEGLQW